MMRKCEKELSATIKSDKEKELISSRSRQKWRKKPKKVKMKTRMKIKKNSKKKSQKNQKMNLKMMMKNPTLLSLKTIIKTLKGLEKYVSMMKRYKKIQERRVNYKNNATK